MASSHRVSWLDELVVCLSEYASPGGVTVSDSSNGRVDVKVAVGPGSVLGLVSELRSFCRTRPEVQVVYWERGWRAARVILASPAADGSYTGCVLRMLGARPMRSSGRLRRTGGMNVVLYGPDGVGKSSAATGLAHSLRWLGVPTGNVATYHAFVPIDRLDARSTSAATTLKTAAYGRLSHPIIRACALMGAYGKRLVLLEARIRPLVRRGRIIIHDRYLFDVFLKAQKSYPEALPGLVRLLTRLTHRTDLVFVLRAEPNVVYGRTAELLPEEVRAVYALLDLCLVQARSHRVDVDANGTSDAVHAALLHDILAVQTARFLGSDLDR